ncbi:Rtf2 RING-finger-domain-containing protein [Dipodascopsis tothii]|uniref:Rtf2 RING-finger-domain-containing protein n=1 Tax=Dipodascopsis tothii TaxID=44089 RepID=UPI0034CE5297
MGNDGGSIPTRRELVKESARAKTTSEIFAQAQLDAKLLWSTCHLSRKPLQAPVVSDYLGRLYNKDAVLEWLIAPDTFADGPGLVGHIKSIKDVVEVHFGRQDGSDRWVCPVTRKELGAGSRFVYHAECGHVFAESALKEIAGDSCLECGAPVARDNRVLLNAAADADVAALRARLDRLAAAGLSHALKKASRKKKRDRDDGADKKRRRHDGINNKDAAAAAAAVMHAVNSKSARSDNVDGLYIKPAGLQPVPKAQP